MNCLSLFSGIGGLDIASEWAGFKTLAFVERDAFCTKVLNKHWEGVPVFEDVKQVTVELLAPCGIAPGGLTLMHGGFPCQPFSHAGIRKGTNDDRHLWPEYLRIIKLFRPTWVCAENVRGLLSMDMPDEVGSEVSETVLHTIRQDLAEAGYQSRIFLLPASAVGAPHQRYRTFIVAHTTPRYGEERDGDSTVLPGRDARLDARGGSNGQHGRGTGEDVAYAEHNGREPGGKPETWRSDNRNRGLTTQGSNGNIGRLQPDAGESSASGGYPTVTGLPNWAGGEMGQPGPVTEFERPGGREIERNFRGVVNGVSRRVDRLRALGNAVVPQQAYPIFKAIADWEVMG